MAHRAVQQYMCRNSFRKGLRLSPRRPRFLATVPRLFQAEVCAWRCTACGLCLDAFFKTVCVNLALFPIINCGNLGCTCAWSQIAARKVIAPRRSAVAGPFPTAFASPPGAGLLEVDPQGLLSSLALLGSKAEPAPEERSLRKKNQFREAKKCPKF